MVCVIGDIHGCFNTLQLLYRQINERYPSVPIFSVGDLVDRGNFSYEVVQFILDKNISFTPGNHDYMFYHFFENPSSFFARSWVFNGYKKTLDSYYNREETLIQHIAAIKSSSLYYNTYDCFISHAGISNVFKNNFKPIIGENLSLLNQYIIENYNSEHGILWTRDQLLNIGKLQVVGHTKQNEVVLDQSAQALYIDTGVEIGNKLTAVIIDDNEVIETISQNTVLKDIL